MYTKRNFGMMPRTVNGLMEDIFFNGLHRISEDVNHGHVPVNIKETTNGFELEVVAPGLKKEEFKINVDKSNLTVSYEHKEEQKEAGEDHKWVRTEYKYHGFKRTFSMTDKIDTTKITARYADGVLTISLPRKEAIEPTSQEIAIN